MKECLVSSRTGPYGSVDRLAHIPSIGSLNGAAVFYCQRCGQKLDTVQELAAAFQIPVRMLTGEAK